MPVSAPGRIRWVTIAATFQYALLQEATWSHSVFQLMAWIAPTAGLQVVGGSTSALFQFLYS